MKPRATSTESNVVRRKVLVGGGRFTFLNWCRENNISPHSHDIYYIGHDEELLHGLELKEEDIVRLGAIGHRMEETLRSRLR